MKIFPLLFLLVFCVDVPAANVFCSELPIAAPDPADPICSVITQEGLTGDVDTILAALADTTAESCKRDSMSGKDIRASVDATEYGALDATQKSLFVALTSGGEELNPYGFGEIAITQIFGSGATLTALAVVRVQDVSLNTLYGLSPRAIDVQNCSG